MKIFHLPIDLGGHASGLAAAQRELGHDATAISLQWSALGFNGDLCLEPPPGARSRLLRREAARFRLLWRTLRDADVIHCHFGQTALSVRPFPVRDGGATDSASESLRVAYARLLWLKDLGLWCLAGKVLAMSFYGDDIRPIAASVARNRFSHLGLPEIAAPLSARDPLRPTFLRAIDRRVPLLYAANPDLLEILPARARWIGYSHCDHRRVAPRPWPETGDDLRILHMPTNRAVKGTAMLCEAVARLRAQGVCLSLTLVEGQDNARALARLDDHHLLVDQLRVGWYGGVAVEAMAAARPVVCHVHPADAALAPAGLLAALPLIEANPETIADVLRSLATTRRAELEGLGRASRRFAEAWHDPLRIAGALIEDYKGAGAR